MKTRSEPSLFRGKIFCYKVIDAAILGFIFDSVFAVFKHSAHTGGVMRAVLLYQK